MHNSTMQVRRLEANEVKPLRHLVLWPHIERVEDCILAIDGLPETMHMGAEVNGEICSIGTFYPESSPKVNAHAPYRLRAMATHPDFRRQHMGERLIREALEELQHQGADVLWCDARLKAVPFYASLGFQALPEVYDVPNIGPHQFMWIHIK